MDADFWLERWHDGHTGFHQNTVMPLLQQYWPSLGLPVNSRVLVPLCGKSMDMIWLAQQGHHVLGIELSPLAVDQFFAENNLRPNIRESALGRHYVTDNIEIICGDIFRLDASVFAQCTAVYDRAALIALPPTMRKQYVQHVYAKLPPYRGLLITLNYDQHKMDGPPFSVQDAEVQSLYKGHSSAKILDQHSVLAQEPKFAQRGLTQLDTVVYQLDKLTSTGDN